MENNNRQGQNRNFEQEFMSKLNSSGMENALSSEKNNNIKPLWTILGIILAFVLVAIITTVSIVSLNNNPDEETSIEDEDSSDNDFFEAETSMIEILVAPSTAKVTIGGEQYASGTYELAPGFYDVLIEESGFESYTSTIVVSDKHKTFVTACLQPIQGNEGYYNNNPDQYSLCQASSEIADVSAWDQTALTDEIFNYTPFHDDEEGFYVDPYYNDNKKLIIELTFVDCPQDEAVLEEKAYNWMRGHELDPTKYTFEKTWDCEE